MRSFSLHEAFVKQARDSTRQGALCKLRSLQVALCKLLCASCSVQVALRKLFCASCSRQGALRKLVGASWSAQVALCNLLCASCSAQVALKCKLHLATRPRTREEIEPATRRFREQAREPRDNSRGPVRTTKVAKNLEFLHLDHAEPRRGLCEQVKHRKIPWVFAPRPCRFPQRVARAG